MSRVLGSIFCDLDPLTLGSRSNNVFSCKCISLTIGCSKVKSEKMYFLVNASPPKLLDVATSNFADALVRSKAGICDGVPSTEV